MSRLYETTLPKLADVERLARRPESLRETRHVLSWTRFAGIHPQGHQVRGAFRRDLNSWCAKRDACATVGQML